MENNVRFNQEADSLNYSMLGPDARPGTPEFDLFVKEVVREMTVKAGQKCTAIRRTFVPAPMVDDVIAALGKRLAGVKVGDPRVEGVRMGPLAGKGQQREVARSLDLLKRGAEVAWGGGDFDVVGADREKGAFFPATLLYNERAFERSEPHDVEAFGPVNTVMPYASVDEAIELAKLGKGSLVGSLFTADDRVARDVTLGTAAYHGRLMLVNRDSAGESTGHGSPLPHLVHGGPGRAGGGEEMGGVRGVKHYMQRVAIQGSPSAISAITQSYQQGGAATESETHPFRKHFEELQVGDTLHTHRRTVTEADIVNFANVSWDHFYAHTDHTSLEGTMFEKPVAHGYFILSAAAGLFVDAKKGPVLLNYGLDECRFMKPVYAGSTIGVKLTVKEKLPQDPRDADDIPKGIVKWLVEVTDETGEHVAVATILTMVAKRKKE
jgi:oxepin-CoA hydrolase/3-oxo-5,6-dehydrosuberyl-CoA semialdehyde dehydrogenase